jgi:hypothetical protein
MDRALSAEALRVIVDGHRDRHFISATAGPTSPNQPTTGVEPLLRSAP